MYSDCERVREWVSAQLDGELSEFEAVLVAGHLAACPACTAFQASATRVSAELRDAPLEPFRTYVELKRRRRASLRLAPVAAALAVGAVGLGTVLTSADLRTSVGNAGAEPASARPSADTSPTNLLSQAGAERQRSGKSGPARRIAGGPVLRQ